MEWWGWMVVGAILLGAELFVIEAEFFLVFIGVSAILTGLAVGAAPGLPLWGQIILFATLSLVSMVFFRKRVYARLRPGVADRPPDMAGDRVQVPQALAPGETCRVQYRGTTWDARNDGQQAIPAGATARILGTQGITMQIASLESQ